MINRLFTCLLLAFAFICLSANLRSQDSARGESLGKVSFPISCSPETQAEFERGVALMHSFQYPSAQPVFAGLTEKDPRCAMAWWGRAINLYHHLWNWPNAEALREGHDYIAHARSAGPVTERERMYIDAAAAFYDDSPKLDRKQRLANYSAKMAELRKQHPEDIEAGSLYALTLISGPREDEAGARRESIAILQDLFARAPDHPGVDHYLIHATDKSEFAAQGLKAAERYAITAPSSSHALHMPSHIFAQLGMWQQMIDSNLAAAASAADAARKDKNNGAEYQIHPMHYLSYAYLQTGRDDEAQKLADSLKDVPAIQPDEITDEGIAMRALTVMETHRWNMAAQLDDKAPTVAFVRMRVHWARTIAAAHLGDRKAAQHNAKKLRQDYAALRKERGILRESNPMVSEAEAWMEFVRGKTDKAISKMREAADHDEFGVDEFSLPAREQLGDLLMELKRPAEALEAYELMLRTAPGRFDSLWGAGRAAELADRPEIAARYYAELLKTAAPSSDRPERQQAMTFLEKKRASANGSSPM